MYKHILIAADGSDNSVRAANEAVKLARMSTDTFIEVLLVIDPDRIRDEVLHSPNHEEIEFYRQERLQPVLDVLSGAELQPKLTTVKGEPGPTIVKYADANNVDLIVIGTRGLNALQEFVLGSVSHKVVKRAHCPVLIVK
ncbi:universal stress protein [Paenibacillus hunanensis]|uniref:universal stress protein n=1 Tax=Paenibacillus hunanensis TaxID=539262 RepID=UPI002A6AE51E|nr:universal stress protein [Paenibacillus hunanensis]WPP40954.1 universal stress protein [Paenibacillus hunanensis]